MSDQEVQSHAFVAEASNVYCAVVIDVDGGVCCRWPVRKVVHYPREMKHISTAFRLTS